MVNLSPETSKLPNEKESIFTTMSHLAAKNDAIDLSQGFPNFKTDDLLKELVSKAMKEGFNQYPPMAGVMELREGMAKKIENLYGRKYDTETEITGANGAAQTIDTAITAFAR